MPRKHLLFLGFVAAGLAACNQQALRAPDGEQSSDAAGEIGSRLPDFSVKDLQGRSLSSAELRGKVVLIDFWATWCEPCKKEMPGYQKLMDRYGVNRLAVVGLKFDIMKDSEDPVQFANRMGVRYPLAVATDELKRKFGGIEGLPTTMLYDRGGILRKKVIGFEYTWVFEAELKPFLR
jgi:thiol-disulfide isomerase/thioredoxin